MCLYDLEQQYAALRLIITSNPSKINKEGQTRFHVASSIKPKFSNMKNIPNRMRVVPQRIADLKILV